MKTTSTSRTEEWLEGEFRRHHRAVLAYVQRRVPGQDADDVLAEVFAAAWRHRDRVPEDALPWLYRTASNHVMHVHRSAARRGRLASRFAAFAGPQQPVPDHAGGGPGTDGGLVRDVLARLAGRDAEVLRLDAWEQLTGDELAYVLGCSATAARVRLHRARRRFAAAYTAVHDAGPVRAIEDTNDCESRR